MGNKLFVGGLNYATTEEDLVKLFSQYGDVLVVRIVLEHETGRSRGFGFVTFSTSENAQKAMEALDNTIFGERRIGVKVAIKKG